MSNLVNVQASLVESTAETILQIEADDTSRGLIFGFGVSFDGADPTDPPALVELLRQTTAGTSAGSPDVAPLDPADSAPDAVAHSDFSAEPTPGVVLYSVYVSPAGGMVYFQFVTGEEIVVPVEGFVGLRVTPSADVDATAWVLFGDEP